MLKSRLKIIAANDEKSGFIHERLLIGNKQNCDRYAEINHRNLLLNFPAFFVTMPLIFNI